MFYGLYNRKPKLPKIAAYVLTRKEVLGSEEQTPWLTTRKMEAIEMLQHLLQTYPDVTVELVIVSAFVPWKVRQNEM